MAAAVIRLAQPSMLVKWGEMVVGEVLKVPGGYAYKHYKFGMRPSSALPTIDALMEKVKDFVEKQYG